MSKLLRANMKRLWKDKMLWLTCLVCLGAAVIGSVDSSESGKAMLERGFECFAEEYFYGMTPVLAMFLGVFASLFFGTEHSDGTIRNKLIAGRTRKQIYVAGFVTCLTAGYLILVCWLAGASVFLWVSGIPFENGYTELIIYLILLTGIMTAAAAIYTLIGNLCTNKAMAVVLSFLVFFGLMMLASGMYDRLGEMEYVSEFLLVNGEPIETSRTLNPLYLSGRVREVFQVLLELNPIGQGILLANAEVVNPIRQLLFSLTATAVLLLTGMHLFEKKDLK